MKFENKQINIETQPSFNIQYLDLIDDLDFKNYCIASEEAFSGAFDKKEALSDIKKIIINDILVGYITFVVCEDNEFSFSNFIILPEFRNTNYGSLVLTDILDTNKKIYDEIFCFVNMFNEGAIRFYNRFGTVIPIKNTKGEYLVLFYDKNNKFQQSITEKPHDRKKEEQKVLDFLKLKEDLKDDAKEYFGTTDEIDKAFYINTDGTLLDGSGKKFGSSGNSRTVDHREISDIFKDGINGNDAMQLYMNDGNIRLMPEAPGIDLVKEPTDKQYDKLQDVTTHFEDEFYVDFSDGYGSTVEEKSYEWPETRQVVSDIKNYFNEDLKNLPQYLYHATYKQFLPAIKKYGLGNTNKKMWSDSVPGVVYLAAGKDEAISYAETAEWLDNLDDDKYDDYIANIIVLKIPTKNLIKNNLYKDKNVIDGNTTYEYHGIIDLSNPEILTEDTRNQLIAKSRNAGVYKDTSKGKNRFERKKLSKIANQVKSYNQIDMNDLFKKDELQVVVPVVGETNTYNVTIKFEGIIKELSKNIQNNKNIFEYKCVFQALTKLFNTANVFIKCNCDDFIFNFDYWSIVGGFGVNDSAHNPGPGKGIANPKNDKGVGCKHILLVLSNLTWLNNVASVIKNYINYAAEHMKPAFLKLIFPKLYGVTADAAAEEGLVSEDTKLETEKNVIDTINTWAKERGKFKPGSNKNPVAAKEETK